MADSDDGLEVVGESNGFVHKRPDKRQRPTNPVRSADAVSLPSSGADREQGAGAGGGGGAAAAGGGGGRSRGRKRERSQAAAVVPEEEDAQPQTWVEPDRWSSSHDIARAEAKDKAAAEAGTGWDLPPALDEPLDDDEPGPDDLDNDVSRQARSNALQHQLWAAAEQRQAKERRERPERRASGEAEREEREERDEQEEQEERPRKARRASPSDFYAAAPSSPAAASTRSTRGSVSTVIKLKELPLGIERQEIEFFLQFAAEPKPRIVDVQFKRATPSSTSNGLDVAFVEFATAQDATESLKKDRDVIYAHGGQVQSEAVVVRSCTADRDRARQVSDLKSQGMGGLRQTTMQGAFASSAQSTRRAGRKRSHSRQQQSTEGNSANTAISLGEDEATAGAAAAASATSGGECAADGDSVTQKQRNRIKVFSAMTNSLAPSEAELAAMTKDEAAQWQHERWAEWVGHGLGWRQQQEQQADVVER